MKSFATKSTLLLACLFLVCIGCRQNSPSIVDLTQAQLNNENGFLIIEIPEQIGKLGQTAVVEYLAVFSFEEIADMSEELRVATFLDLNRLSAPMANLLVEQGIPSSELLQEHLAEDQIIALNSFELTENPEYCYSNYRYKWDYSGSQWTKEKCGDLQECIGSAWEPVEDYLCVVSEKEDAPMNWATAFPQ